MPRTTSHHSKRESKNSAEVAKQHYQAEQHRLRGVRDALAATQQCELIPMDIHKAELADAWRLGYQEGWKSKVKP